jgi:peptidoglycan/xylan/chitin deacetylase (PgdA/CDA1 family)
MMNRVKIFFGWLAHFAGIHAVVRTFNNLIGKRLTILTFHRVAHSSNGEVRGLPTLYLQQEPFEKLIAFLKRNFTILAMSEYCEIVASHGKLPWNSLILTFDDGYNDFHTNAFPVLRKHGVPASVFIPTAMIGTRQTFWWDEYSFAENVKNGRPTISHFSEYIHGKVTELQNQPRVKEIMFAEGNCDSSLWHAFKNHNQLMSWIQIRELVDAGIEFGSHTRTHVFLTAVSADQAFFEIVGSKTELEWRLAHNAMAFSYPGGKVSSKIRDWVRAAGYRCAVTTEAGINSLATDPFNLKRINIWDGSVLNGRGHFSPALFRLHWLRSLLKRNAIRKNKRVIEEVVPPATNP